eukprot:1002234-Prorocentrum_minimum.AAC.1
MGGVHCEGLTPGVRVGVRGSLRVVVRVCARGCEGLTPGVRTGVRGSLRVCARALRDEAVLTKERAAAGLWDKGAPPPPRWEQLEASAREEKALRWVPQGVSEGVVRGRQG